MAKATTALLTAALAAAGSALAGAQQHEPQGWAAAHCSADTVRARHRNYVDETTLEGLFALASMERECEAAAAASAEPEPRFVYQRPWTAFCSDAGLRGRHPNADGSLLSFLYEECQDALQAAADTEQELRLCRYSSVSECDPDRGCTTRRSAPAPDERWLEVPPLDMELDMAGLSSPGSATVHGRRSGDATHGVATGSRWTPDRRARTSSLSSGTGRGS